MPALRMSSAIATGIIYTPGDSSTSLISTTNSTIPTNAYVISGWLSTVYAVGITSRLNIYKGIPGTFPALTDLANRSSDLLVSFTLANGGTAAQSIGVVDQKVRWLIGKNLNSTTATGTGEATWFVIYNTVNNGTTMNNRGAMIGSVGVTGTNADLEIPNIEIVSGANYQCAGFYINMPQSRTF